MCPFHAVPAVVLGEVTLLAVDDIAQWLIVLADAQAEHDVDEITRATTVLDRLLREPVVLASS